MRSTGYIQTETTRFSFVSSIGLGPLEDQPYPPEALPLRPCGCNKESPFACTRGDSFLEGICGYVCPCQCHRRVQRCQ